MSDQAKPKFFITTPIYYPNARPHVGSAYTTIACDAMARYKRMCGYDVAFLTGTDEHGEKLQRAADEAGIPVERFVVEKRELFKDLWRTLGIPSYSPEHPAGYRFVHTSQNPAHVKSVQWMIRQAAKAGYVEKKKYEGRYCVYDERYVSDNPEPVNCDICGRPAELISEENYFFNLSAFQDRLLKHYEDHPEFVQPDFRMNEVKSFVKSGLRDISISRRRLRWGIPWPEDPEQVVYVWYDALTSYLTGIGFEGEKRNKDFEKYWPADVHMIGKDILRFHAVYWPAFLWAAGLALPKTIFAHGWIYYAQDKMSKSKGNVVYPEPIIQAFEEFGAPGNDALRYYLLRDTPFGQDGSFSYQGLINRYNSDLANGLGNLTSRTLAMIDRYCGGKIPDAAGLNAQSPTEWFSPEVDASRRAYVERQICPAYDECQFSIAAEKIWREIVAHYGDEFLTVWQPWAEAQNPGQRWLVDGVLYIALEAVRAAAVLGHPIIPESTRKIWTQLGSEDYLGQIEDQKLNNWEWRRLKIGTKVGKPEPIFPRLDKEKTLRRLHELAEQDREPNRATQEESVMMKPRPDQEIIMTKASGLESGATTPEPRPLTAAPPDQRITIADFVKVDLRAGTILSAEPIPGATKLLKLQVDIGSEVRQVCAGIAEYYKPEELIGMSVIIVANLQPRKLRGVESKGMIVAASVGPEGKPVLATFKEGVPNGARLK